MLFLLSIAARRSVPYDPVLSNLVLQGHLRDAVALGQTKLMGGGADDDIGQLQPEVGQVTSRVMLLLGREEAASDLIQSLLKVYDNVSRAAVRQYSALDQGWMHLCLNRPGDAVQAWRSLADDQSAPLPLRIEACCGMGMALLSLAECASAMNVFMKARSLCDEGVAQNLQEVVDLVPLVDCHFGELAAQLYLRRSDTLADHAFASGYRDVYGTSMPDVEALTVQLRSLESSVSDYDVALRRLKHLQVLVRETSNITADVASLASCLRWIRDEKLTGIESQTRIEASLALIARGCMAAAREFIAALARDERLVSHSRHSLELQYCLSKLYMSEGKHVDALRLYKRHTEQAVRMIHRCLAQLATSRREADVTSRMESDGTRARLPVRYRAAYRYIMEHLHESELSVHMVACQVGVTERALQIAFRTHLGQTPAEFIRSERLKKINAELEEQQQSGGTSRQTLLDIAERWGIKKRSTLVHGYKRQFAVTPSETLRGG